MPQALSSILVLVLFAGLAFAVWRIVRPRDGESQSTDDGYPDEHETLARDPETVFGARPPFVVNGKPLPPPMIEERALRQLAFTSAEPLPRFMVFERSADVAEAAEHKLRAGDPTMRHTTLVIPTPALDRVEFPRDVLTDGYDFRPARDCGPPLHAEGL
jgi:hypothetical protein